MKFLQLTRILFLLQIYQRPWLNLKTTSWLPWMGERKSSTRDFWTISANKPFGEATLPPISVPNIIDLWIVNSYGILISKGGTGYEKTICRITIADSRFNWMGRGTQFACPFSACRSKVSCRFSAFRLRKSECPTGGHTAYAFNRNLR